VRKLILALMLSVLLLGFGTAMAATSAVDNLPGGAGITYWQAGGTWETLVNIQSIDAGCSSIAHVAIYDRDSVHLIDFNMKLTMLDNVGIIIRQGAAVGQIDLFDYSDGAYGGTAALFDIAVGPPVTVLAPADAGTGIMRGYLTITLNSQDCVAPIGDPELGPTWGPIQGVFAIAPDVLIVRSAIINPIQAFASNAAMIQGFANIAAPGTFEAFDFCDTTPGGNPFAACDFNKDGDLADVFAGLDDANGANVDFTELFLTDNAISHATPCIMCDLAGLFNINYPALGAANGIYWGRFNESVSAGTNTTLVTISPNSTSGLHGATTPGWPRNLTVISYNDAEVGLSYGPVAIPEVAGIGFGLGGITVGSATAGEARISIAAPIMGFTVTETAAFADIYPLVKEVLAISSINQGMPDVPFDQIFLP
jgi:hypothetical protein